MEFPKEQLSKVLSQEMCDIDGDFLGFTDVYEHLAAIIPKHWTIVDLGCAYAPQSWIFKDHKEYIGVDKSDCEKFHAPNSSFFISSIEEFVKNHLKEFDQETTFAICSYVPPWGADNMKIARDNFKNVFTYYPSGERVNLEELSNPK